MVGHLSGFKPHLITSGSVRECVSVCMCLSLFLSLYLCVCRCVCLCVTKAESWTFLGHIRVISGPESPAIRGKNLGLGCFVRGRLFLYASSRHISKVVPGVSLQVECVEKDC